MTLALVIVAGVAVLMVLAVSIGASMDTEAQRREWRRVAEQRRQLREEALAGSVDGAADASLCGDCPYRRAAAGG